MNLLSKAKNVLFFSQFSYSRIWGRKIVLSAVSWLEIKVCNGIRQIKRTDLNEMMMTTEWKKSIE